MPRPAEPPVTTPRSLAEAYALLADAGPAWRPLAGGTDVMVQITGELGDPPDRLLDLWRLDELRGIGLEDDVLVIGALVTYAQLRRSPVIVERMPVLAGAASTIGAAAIQNRGTIGGNVANASPAGDTLPILLASDAEIVLGSASGERRVEAAEFWTAYRRTARRADELVRAIRIPLVAGRQLRFRKVGTRRAQAISKVVMALAWKTDAAAAPGSRDAWRNVRLALGSVADRPVRAWETEAVLEGSAPDPKIATRAVAALASEIHPIDDVRSTAAYRLAVAARVLERVLREEGNW